jgi:Flp pilus assembly protein TadG
MLVFGTCSLPSTLLAPVFAVLMFIWLSVEQAQASKRQLQALAQTIAQLLWTLDKEYSAGRLVQSLTLTHITNLGRFVELLALIIDLGYN